MRKFKLLLTLALVLTCLGLNAQVTTKYVTELGTPITELSGINESNYYVLKNIKGLYASFYGTTDHPLLVQESAMLNVADKVSAGSLVQITPITGDNATTYKIKFVLGDLYMSQDSRGAGAVTYPLLTVEEAKVATFTIEKAYKTTDGVNVYSENQFTLKKNEGDKKYLDGGGSSEMALWGDRSSTDGNGAYQIIPVSTEDITFYTSVTFNYTVTGSGLTEALTYTETKTGYFANPAAEASLNSADFRTVTASGDAVVEGGTWTLNYDVVLNYPFNLTLPGDDGALTSPTFYTLYSRNSPSDRSIRYVDATTVNSRSASGISVDYLWCFVPNTEKPWQVKMYNVKADAYITATTTNKAKVGCNASLTEATPLNVIKNKNAGNGGTGFTLLHPDNANFCLGDHAPDNFVTWNHGTNHSDDGSMLIATAQTITYNDVKHTYKFTGAGLPEGGLTYEIHYKAHAGDPLNDVHPFVQDNIKLTLDATAEPVIDAVNKTWAKTYNVTLNYPFNLSVPNDDGTLTAPKLYTILVKNDAGKALRYVTESHISCKTSKSAQDDYWWCFVPNMEKPWQVKIYSVHGGTYLRAATGSSQAYCDQPIADATSFNVMNNSSDNTTTEPKSGFSLQHVGNANSCLGAHSNVDGDGANNSFGIWDSGSALNDKGSLLTAEAYEYDYLNVTYNFVVKGGGLPVDGLTSTISEKYYVGDPANEYAFNNHLLELEVSEPVIDAVNKTWAKTYNVTLNYPFSLCVPGENGELNNATFYTAFLRNLPDTRAIKYVDENQTLSRAATRLVDPAYMWCFVPDTEKPWRVKMYSLAALKYASVSAPSGTDGKANVKCNVELNDATSFNVLLNTTGNNYENGFTLQHSNEVKVCLGDHNSNNLAAWYHANSSTDEGSKMNVQPVDDPSFMYASLLMADKKYVGACFAPSAVATAYNTYAAAKTPANFKAYVEAYQTAVADGFTFEGPMTLAESNYYRIIYAYGNPTQNVMVTSADTYADVSGVYGGNQNRELTRNPFDEKDLSALWTFEPSVQDGTTYYKLSNANAKRCAGYTAADIPESAQYEGLWSIVQGNEGDMWCLGAKNSGGKFLQIYNGIGYHDLGVWDTNPKANQNNWKIQLVEEVPVTIGTAGYASLVLPYAVELPEGIKAYYATCGVTAGDVIVLAEWTEMNEEGKVVLPANMPVILYSQAVADAAPEAGENVTLTITTTTLEAPVNELKGYTMKRHSENGEFEGVYALRKNENVLGRVAATVKNFPANRAYIEAVSSEAPAFRLSFGELTGIEDVPAAALSSENEVYYDLSGRRVWAPKNGIFVTASGKKVFIK